MGEPDFIHFMPIDENDRLTATINDTLFSTSQIPEMDDAHMAALLQAFTNDDSDNFTTEVSRRVDSFSCEPLLQSINPSCLLLSNPSDSEMSTSDDIVFSNEPSSGDSTIGSSVSPDPTDKGVLVSTLPIQTCTAKDRFTVMNTCTATPPTPAVSMPSEYQQLGNPGESHPQNIQSQQMFPQSFYSQPVYAQPMYTPHMYTQPIYPPSGPELSAQPNMTMAPVYSMDYNCNMPPYGFIPSHYQHTYQMAPPMGPLVDQQQLFVEPAPIAPSIAPPSKRVNPAQHTVPASNTRVFDFSNTTCPGEFVANPNNHGRWEYDRHGQRRYLNAPAVKRLSGKK
ncbi:hypothetical protein N7520_001240 [Penicillium odoratum]|uniref:uncharacterized protein n=1 Tax=Penicillium odoratum TaxID=1167516 RepID=UPI002549B310|nr:uncharacterized protein N7520_001240 [Penicillium odoratum]KAJ5777994.1 hypothetical protein N7520_001240 [Penicillium odoratum]